MSWCAGPVADPPDPIVMKTHPTILIAAGLGLCLAGLGGYFLLRSGADQDPGDIDDRATPGIGSLPDQAALPATPIEFPSLAPESGVDKQLAHLAPGQDGWESEALSSAADEALRKILSGGSDPGSWPVAIELTGTAPDSQSDTTVFDRGGMVVRRSEVQGASTKLDRSKFEQYLGEGGLPSGYRKHKISRIELGEGEFSTRVLVWASGETDAGGYEQVSSIWQCVWDDAAPAESEVASPILKQVNVVFREHITRAGKRPLFEDITESVLPPEEGRSRGITDWAQRLTVIDEMLFFGHHGIAVGDADGDGLDDLYVCDAGGLPNRLYLQNPDGTARDASAEAGVDWLELSRSALFLDLDNDGDQDLVIATIADALLLMENDGHGKFSLARGIPRMEGPHSISAADYDRDGDLDLFVCNYRRTGEQLGPRGFESSSPVPYNDAKNGGRNTLLRNDGELRFTEVTAEAGLDVGGDRWSFASSWEDYDNDGDQDLYVANDFGRNNLFRCDGDGRFTDVAAATGVEDMAAGMSVDWGDADRDGVMDIYVANMFSSAGGRVAFQRRFVERHKDESAGLQRMARGNTLFMGTDGASFRDASLSAGVEVGLWAWGSLFADINNDGWQDLVVQNGFHTNPRGGSDL